MDTESGTHPDAANGRFEPEDRLRDVLGANGQRYTEQRAAVYRYLRSTATHPTADDVFTAVRTEIPDISLATVYKALETLVGCELAVKMAHADGCARYDSRTDPHPHARCVRCGSVADVPGRIDPSTLGGLGAVDGFEVRGYRLELIGLCPSCR